MRVNKHIRYLIAMLAICACFICDAKKVVDIYELTFDENVNSPAIVKDNIAQRVQDFQNKQSGSGTDAKWRGDYRHYSR